MPELPEVTTIVFGLNKKVKGLTIRDIWTDWPKTIKSHSFTEFKKEVIGKKILTSERVGKNVLTHLSGNKTILFHMKMTGHLLYGKWKLKKEGDKNIWKPEKEGTPLSDPYNRFIHIIFYLSNGYELAFSDVRKFGKIVLLEEGKEFESKDLKHLGPDPMKKDFNFAKFKKALSKKKDGAIKQILMAQEIISGIGNIYSDEILWRAGINPKERLKKLNEKDLRNIFTATKDILGRSIKMGGDSMSDFRNIEGEKGSYQKCHLVYRQTGKACNKKGCKGIIRRTKVGGRSAHFCETHQALK
ncbi:MAG TPA: DNA-formamidopyrimidine glycosylase [Candidatus Paceibacterota bacterium]|nr:DNA-formamidopyrimidine glycosylase [Candidatus Paceibacterota bacterium]